MLTFFFLNILNVDLVCKYLFASIAAMCSIQGNQLIVSHSGQLNDIRERQQPCFFPLLPLGELAFSLSSIAHLPLHFLYGKIFSLFW